MNELATVISTSELKQLQDMVKEYLEESGESLTSLSARVGIGRSMLTNIVNDKYPSSPTLDVVCKILNAIGCKLIFEKSS
jgi:transcriptional regulator with XRE-family HTH domain